MCFGCSKEPSHRGGSFEYPQHMFWLRNKKKKFLLRTLIVGSGPDVTSASSLFAKICVCKFLVCKG